MLMQKYPKRLNPLFILCHCVIRIVINEKCKPRTTRDTSDDKFLKNEVVVRPNAIFSTIPYSLDQLSRGSTVVLVQRDVIRVVRGLQLETKLLYQKVYILLRCTNCLAHENRNNAELRKSINLSSTCSRSSFAVTSDTKVTS